MTRILIRPLHEEVAAKIREMIRKGVLQKGDRLVEADLSAAIGVSRTPLREAFRVLSAEGLVEVVPHRGAFVRQPSMDEIREMFDVMSVLEGVCARLATEKLTPSDLKRLEKHHDRLETHYQAGDRDKYIEANNAYHALVQELAGNRILDEIVRGLRGKVALYRHQQIFEEKRFDESIREHRVILDAFRAADPVAAERAMKFHLLRQCQALVNVYEHGTPPRTRRLSA